MVPCGGLHAASGLPAERNGGLQPCPARCGLLGSWHLLYAMRKGGLVLTARRLAECLLGVHVTSVLAVARICSRQETGASPPPPHALQPMLEVLAWPGLLFAGLQRSPRHCCCSVQAAGD